MNVNSGRKYNLSWFGMYLCVDEMKWGEVISQRPFYRHIGWAVMIFWSLEFSKCPEACMPMTWFQNYHLFWNLSKRTSFYDGGLSKQTFLYAGAVKNIINKTFHGVLLVRYFATTFSYKNGENFSFSQLF